MKRINIMSSKILVIALSVVVFLTGCDKENTVFEGPNHVKFDAATGSIDENSAGDLDVKLHFVGPKPSEAITVQLAVTGGEEGTDFEFVDGGTTLTIPAGDFFTSFSVAPIDNEEFATNKVITFTITSISGGITAGQQGLVGKAFKLTLLEDDCPIPSLVGTYRVYNRDASPSACGNPANDAALTYDATITLVSDDGDGKFTYAVTDVTGGLYALCYGDGENPGEIETDGFAITLTDQPDVVYGGDEFNGSGTMDCDGNFTLTWGNHYGDKGTSHYTKN